MVEVLSDQKPFPQGYIDYDRGVQIRTHDISGIDIYMYVDDPGVFLSAHATPVSEEMAKQAGYPVEELSRKRELKRQLKLAADAVYAQYNEPQQEQIVVATSPQGFTIVDIGLGRHHIMSPDGDKLTDNPLPLEQATEVLAALDPQPEPDAKA